MIPGEQSDTLVIKEQGRVKMESDIGVPPVPPPSHGHVQAPIPHLTLENFNLESQVNCPLS